MPWNTEVLVLVERRSGQRITALAHAKAMSVNVDASSWEEVAAAAEHAGFPNHHLVVRRDGIDGTIIAKGIACMDGLRKVVSRAKSAHPDLKLHIENDLRAYANPTRQTVIRQAGADLVRRFQCRCPQCNGPGFGLLRAQTGAPCASCGSPTRVPRAEVWGCPSCGHQAIKSRPLSMAADPQRCDVCNP